MALDFIPKLSALSIILLFMALAMTTFPVRASHKFKETQLSIYFQQFFGGPKATELPLTGIPGKLWREDQIGTTYVVDDPITEGLDPNSPSVGRFQGLSVVTGLDGLHNHGLYSIVFTNKEYNGSTLEIQGTEKQFEKVREFSVVSGTGKFRFVRGYATFDSFFLDLPRKYLVTRCNITVRHEWDDIVITNKEMINTNPI